MVDGFRDLSLLLMRNLVRLAQCVIPIAGARQVIGNWLGNMFFCSLLHVHLISRNL